MTATTKLAERVGQYLKGRYRVDHVLHTGARSTVYAGADQKSGRVAIKVLDGKADASVLQGSYLANAVGHPSAVNVLDTGSTDDGAIFLVMELLEATSMRELLGQHDGHLPVRLACTLADQGLDLLASAHAQGIAHGELRLDKLFYTRTERLKVLGFGKPANDQAVTEDVRALSEAIAWLLCGEPVESLQAPPAASAIQTRVPPRIASVFERAMSADPALQWKSAHAMRTALQLACKAELGRPIDSTLQPLAARWPARRRFRGVWLAAAAAALGVALYVSREVAELMDARAPEAEAETDIAAARQPPQAKAQAEEANETAAPEAAEQPTPQITNTTTEDDKAPVEATPSTVIPRKPHRADLRLPMQRKGMIQTNIAPLSQLCAQLSSARRAGPLSDHETQLYKARCTKH